MGIELGHRFLCRLRCEEFLGLASAVSFLTYFTLNVLFTGVPVPTGNFTGAMLIGGMAGRLIGCVLGHLLPQMDFAPQGEPENWSDNLIVIWTMF